MVSGRQYKNTFLGLRIFRSESISSFSSRRTFIRVPLLERTAAYTFAYDPVLPGEGRFISTYVGDGNPLPSFEGEPVRVGIPNEIGAFTKLLWESLNNDNKVSLFVRFIDLATGKADTRIINKNQ